ncbi:MAG: hypothetical protein LCH87_07290 [Actinobacteria bacterium]|nr:hypothetical protein [Actinomycetota bacterium]
MTTPSHPMLPFLVDLESAYNPDAERQYDPKDLVAFALSWPGSDYWPGLALGWLEQGVPYSALRDQVSAIEGDRHRSQALRHRARRLLLHLAT